MRGIGYVGVVLDFEVGFGFCIPIYNYILKFCGLFMQGSSENGCGFFRWYDPPMCARSRKVIPR